MKTFSPLLLLFLGINFGCATSQYNTSKEFEHLYVDSVDTGYKLIKTWVDFSVEEKELMLIYKHYTPQTRLLYERIELKKSNLDPHGQVTEWFENGYVRLKGNYSEGKRIGRWEYFSNQNGELEEFGEYEEGNKNGLWTHLDTLGNITATFTYKDDKLDGSFVLYSDGEVYKEGIYSSGELDTVNKFMDVNSHPQEVFDTEFKLVSCESAPKKARIQCRKGNLEAAALHIAQYPKFEKDRKVTGTVLAYIEIDKDGKLSELDIVRSISPNFETAIKKLLETDFVFEPALLNGEAKKTTYLLQLGYYPPEALPYYYHDTFWMHQVMAPPAPNFTPPSF